MHMCSPCTRASDVHGVGVRVAQYTHAVATASLLCRYGTVSQYPHGFFIAGSSLSEMNGVYVMPSESCQCAVIYCGQIPLTTTPTARVHVFLW